jgi:hypothetical protein
MSDNRMTITGGTFTRSAVGVENVHVHNAGGEQHLTVDDLRAALAAGRADILDAARDDMARKALASRVDALSEELEADEPDGEIVRGGWKSVRKLLETGAQAAETITKITDMVGALFGS